MPKRVALLTLHGMGDKDENYYEKLEAGLKKRVGADAWSDVHFKGIFYSDIFQDAQDDLFARVRSKVDSKKLREFLLSGFSDAGGLEHSRTLQDSAYEAVQKRIFDALGDAFAALGRELRPTVLIAQSLGCQVISNYIWDAERHDSRPPGIWSHDHGGLTEDDLKFRKFKSLRLLVTTGCNIPIFVGGLPADEIVPIKKPNDSFRWENYYDQDDPLGWPLRELIGKDRAYETLVTDIEANVGGPFTSWNPLSHGQYWGDRDVQAPLAEHLLTLLAET